MAIPSALDSWPRQDRFFEYVHELPRAELDDLLLSHATLASPPQADRVRVFAQVAEILDGDRSPHRDDRLRLPLSRRDSSITNA